MTEKFVAKAATLEWHILNLARQLTTALLVRYDEGGQEGHLDQEEKDFLVRAARTFLYDINVAEFQNIIGSMRNWRGKAEDVLKRYGGQIEDLLTAIATRFDLGKIEDIRAEADINKATVTAYFERLLRLAVKLGY